MTRSSSSTVELRLSPAVRVVVGLAGLLLLGILVVLVAVLISLEGTRGQIKTTRRAVADTDARVRQVTEGLAPVLAAAAPLTDPRVRRDTRTAAGDVATAAGLIPSLTADVTRGVAAATGIAGEVQGSGLGAALDAGRRLAAITAPAVEDLAPRASRLLQSLEEAVPAVRSSLYRVRHLLHHSLRTQRGTESLNARTVALLEQSLAIQREILVRVRSLDTKLGGPAPTPVP